jgi:hypothetical protein
MKSRCASGRTMDSRRQMTAKSANLKSSVELEETFDRQIQNLGAVKRQRFADLLENSRYPLVIDRDYRKPDVEFILAKVAVGHFGKLPYYPGGSVNIFRFDIHGSQRAAKSELTGVEAGSHPANHSLVEHPLGPVPQFLYRNSQPLGYNFVRFFTKRKIVLKLPEYSAVDFVHKKRSRIGVYFHLTSVYNKDYITHTDRFNLSPL